jgi:hypothetical protein
VATEQIISAGSDISKEVLNASPVGVIGFIAILFVVGLMVLLVMLVSAHLKQLPALTESIKEMTKSSATKMDELTKTMNGRLEQIDSHVVNLYMGTQALADELARAEATSRESRKRAVDAYQDVKQQIEDMPNRLIIAGKKYEPKKTK